MNRIKIKTLLVVTFYFSVLILFTGTLMPGYAQTDDILNLLGQFNGKTDVIFVDDEIAYIGADDVLTILDLSTPDNPIVIGQSDPLSNTIQDIQVVDSVAYLLAGTGGLVTFDVSTPATPTLLGEMDTAGNANRITVVGNVAYIADGDNGLVTVDISDPVAPTLLREVNTAGHANAIVVAEGIAYITNGGNGVATIDVNDPTSPVLLGSIAIASTYGAVDVVVAGEIAYIADGWHGLMTVDVSDPTDLALLGSVSMPGIAVGVAIMDSIAYIATEDNGVAMVNVNDPTSPVPITSIDTVYAGGVHIANNLIYVTSGTDGLHIFESNPPSSPIITCRNILIDAVENRVEVTIVVDTDTAAIDKVRMEMVFDSTTLSNPVLSLDNDFNTILSIDAGADSIVALLGRNSDLGSASGQLQIATITFDWRGGAINDIRFVRGGTDETGSLQYLSDDVMQLEGGSCFMPPNIEPPTATPTPSSEPSEPESPVLITTPDPTEEVAPPSMNCAINDNGDGTVTADFSLNTEGTEIDTGRLEILYNGNALSNPNVVIGSDFNTPGIDATTTAPGGQQFLLQTYGINGTTGSGILDFASITFDWTGDPSTITIQGIDNTIFGQGSLQVLVGESTALNGGSCSMLGGGGNVNGTIRKFGTPVEDIEVRLLDQNGAVFAQTTTDTNGAYQFSAPTNQEYRLLYIIPAIGDVPAEIKEGVTEIVAIDENDTTTALSSSFLLSSTFTNDVAFTQPNLPVTPLTVADIIEDSDTHTILAQAIVVAGLDTVLDSIGNTLTVFAPTNMTLTALGLGVSELTSEVLTNHMIVGSPVMANDITNGITTTTGGGNTLTFMLDGGTVTIEGLVPDLIGVVETADLTADNGVVHSITYETATDPEPPDSTQEEVIPPSMSCAISDNGDGTVTAAFTLNTDGAEIDTGRLEILYDENALSNPTVAIGSDFNTPGIDATTTAPSGLQFLLQTYGINGSTGSGVLDFATITFDWTESPTTITVQGIGTTEIGQGSLQVLVGESTPLNSGSCSTPRGSVGTVSGTVLGFDTPVEGIEVILMGENGAVYAQTTTDDNGFYQFLAPINQNYRIFYIVPPLTVGEIDVPVESAEGIIDIISIDENGTLTGSSELFELSSTFTNDVLYGSPTQVGMSNISPSSGESIHLIVIALLLLTTQTLLSYRPKR